MPSPWHYSVTAQARRPGPRPDVTPTGRSARCRASTASPIYPRSKMAYRTNTYHVSLCDIEYTVHTIIWELSGVAVSWLHTKLHNYCARGISYGTVQGSSYGIPTSRARRCRRCRHAITSVRDPLAAIVASSACFTTVIVTRRPGAEVCKETHWRNTHTLLQRSNAYHSVAVLIGGSSCMRWHSAMHGCTLGGDGTTD